MRPLYALHKGHDGKILGASSFTGDYDLRTWIGKLDLRDGDTLAFGEVSERPEFEEVESDPPLLIAEPEVLRKAPALAEADDEQPF